MKTCNITVVFPYYQFMKINRAGPSSLWVALVNHEFKDKFRRNKQYINFCSYLEANGPILLPSKYIAKRMS